MTRLKLLLYGAAAAQLPVVLAWWWLCGERWPTVGIGIAIALYSWFPVRTPCFCWRRHLETSPPGPLFFHAGS